MVQLTKSKIQMLFIIISFLFATSFSNASTIDTTKVGVFITSIYDLDYINNSFSVEYWLWRLNTKREFKEYHLFEATNSKENELLFTSTTWPDQIDNQLVNKGDTLFWDYESFRSIVKHDYDITKYPFDEEVLTIEFEGSTYYDDWVKLQIDQKASGSSMPKINGWETGDMTIESINIIYPTNFGSPGDTAHHAYSGFVVKLPIKRIGTSLFFKLFSGLLVAFVIALFSLRINITEADGRFGVCVGALFAALANMYIVNSNLPMVSKFTFMDKAHVLTIFLILVLFITSTFSLQYFKQEQLEKSKRLDKRAAYWVISAFIIGMISIWPY